MLARIIHEKPYENPINKSQNIPISPKYIATSITFPDPIMNNTPPNEFMKNLQNRMAVFTQQ